MHDVDLHPDAGLDGLTYDQYIASPAWQALRGQAILRDGGRCRLCDAPDDLQVHHRRYPPLRRWSLDGLDALTTLCAACHQLAEERRRAQAYQQQPLAILAQAQESRVRIDVEPPATIEIVVRYDKRPGAGPVVAREPVRVLAGRGTMGRG